MAVITIAKDAEFVPHQQTCEFQQQKLGFCASIAEKDTLARHSKAPSEGRQADAIWIRTSWLADRTSHQTRKGPFAILVDIDQAAIKENN
jgi:hypothetical protein